MPTPIDYISITMTRLARSFIFTHAWQLARVGARRWGGRSSSYFAAALRLIYAERKNAVMRYYVFDCHEATGHAFVTRSRIIARVASWLLTRLGRRSFDWLDEATFARQ